MANKYTFKLFVNEIINYAKVNIIDLAEKELNNNDRKKQLDKAVTTYIITLLAGAKFNFVTKWIFENYVIKNIPFLTQCIYDLLKAKVKGVTK